MNRTSTAEKIETIVQTRTSGTFGEFVEYVPGKFRVTADGLCVLVQSTAHGWAVSFCGFVSVDPDLYLAARNALNATGRDVTKHTDLTRDLAAWL